MRPKRFLSPCPPSAPPLLGKAAAAGLVILGCLALGLQPGWVQAQEQAGPQFVDLSLLVAPEFPCSWPGAGPGFQINHYRRIGPLSAYNSEILTLDENVGTQFDGPTHSVAPPDSGKPNAGRYGLISGDKVPAWQFVGEACVIDNRELLDAAPDGHSALVEAKHVQAWEKRHRPLGLGDVVLFYSGFSDRYYRSFPSGRGFIADALEGRKPGWPDPSPQCMEYLATRKVMTLGTDSPSMGPIPGPIAEDTHFAGLKHGMIWTEGATQLGKLPVTGAFYCTVGLKHSGGIGAESRAFAIVGQPLAGQLIESARNKRVIDLSVLLADDLPVWWSGKGVGNNRHPYLRSIIPPYGMKLHHLDSHTGTHLVPPAYALPPPGFDNQTYAPEVRQWLAAYQRRFGKRETSRATTEQVPLSQTCGWARVIDVQHLIGTTSKDRWPASPEITPGDIQEYEAKHGSLKRGEIVIFRSGYSDRYFKPFPEGNRFMADPLNGRSEGWPAPGPEAVVYLAERGIGCIGTDGPTLGGAEPRRALMTYWALGSRGLVGIESLTGLGEVPQRAYFIFAPIKIRDCHGGPGRALALY